MIVWVKRVEREGEVGEGEGWVTEARLKVS